MNRSFGERLLGALKLDATVYEEVEHDTTAFGQAAAVVALASIASGIGAYQDGGLGGGLANIAGSFVGWFLGAAFVWLIGVKIMNCTSDYGELIRTLGFASAPGLLAVFGALPLGPIAIVVGLVVFVLSTIAWVIAVRQALDVGTGKAVVVCILANLVPLAVILLLTFVIVGLGFAPTPPPAAPSMGF